MTPSLYNGHFLSELAGLSKNFFEFFSDRIPRLGAFTKVANTFGAVCAFVAASAVMVYIKYFVPADHVSIWSYSIISIVVSLVIGIPASIIWRKVKGDDSVPAPDTTIYKN